MKPTDLCEALTALAKVRQPFFVWGDPGVGKSSIVRQTADALFASDYGYQIGPDGRPFTHAATAKANKVILQPWHRRPWLLDIRAVLLDPVDLRGLPALVDGGPQKAKEMVWALPRILPRAGKGLLFFDELNRAAPLVQNACLQLVLDRVLGDYSMPDGWALGSAGNYEHDVGVQRMSDALVSRFTHLEAEVNLEDFCNYAVRNKFEPVVVAFVKFRPELLHKYDHKDRTRRTFPCPRTYEFLSRILIERHRSVVEYALIEGTIGKEAAVEFVAFLRMYREVPDIDALLASPTRAALPTHPATLYAVASALSRRATLHNVGKIITYLDRVPAQEYAVLAVREAIQMNSSLNAAKAVTDWKVRHADVIF